MLLKNKALLGAFCYAIDTNQDYVDFLSVKKYSEKTSGEADIYDMINRIYIDDFKFDYITDVSNLYGFFEM